MLKGKLKILLFARECAFNLKSMVWKNRNKKLIFAFFGFMILFSTQNTTLYFILGRTVSDQDKLEALIPNTDSISIK